MSIGYEQVYQLRTGDFDRYCRPQPASVLDIFQDIAGVNAESMPNMSFADMQRQQLLWVVTRIRYELVACPALHEQVHVRTWPLAPSRKGFQREYVMESLDGRVYILGSSEWIVMDANTRSFVSVKDIAGEGGDYASETVFDGRLRKIRTFEPHGPGHVLVPAHTDIDVNGHVNNTKYANYALDAVELGPDEPITSFQIDFRHELMDGQETTVYARREGDEVVTMGMQGDVVSFATRMLVGHATS